MTFLNSWDDAARAEAYARLEFPGTYHLAYRDLPDLLRRHAAPGPVRRALDFGCGAGRSTRFLRGLGFDPTGIDVAPDMLGRARALDPHGDYRLVRDGDFAALRGERFDVALAVFTFDNIPPARKVPALRGLADRLRPGGALVVLVSSPEIYTHEWASFTTRAWPENRSAKPGDVVRIALTCVEDPRPVEDILWPDASYRATFAEAGLEVVETARPLADGSEPIRWVNETRIAPWTIYALRPAARPWPWPVRYTMGWKI